MAVRRNVGCVIGWEKLRDVIGGLGKVGDVIGWEKVRDVIGGLEKSGGCDWLGGNEGF